MKRLLKRLVPSYLKQLFREWSFNESTIIYKGLSYRDYLDSALSLMRPNISEKGKVSLLRDIKYAFIKEGFRPDEYLLFELDKKTSEERKGYMSQKMKERILIDYYQDQWPKIISQLKDKYCFYGLTERFFKRELIKVTSVEDAKKLELFCLKNQRVICKPMDSGCGVGVSVIEANTIESWTELCSEMVSKGSWVVEELIDQDEEMAKFNKSSINTVRLPSFKHGKKIIPAYPLVRIGREGSVVDNAAQGGVFACVDVETGIVITNGFDELGNQYERHPDSNIYFKGYSIPKWKELLNLSKIIHSSLPEYHTYVGFDFALSRSGWVLVEGNWGDFYMMEIALQRGLRKEFVDLLYDN